MRLVPFQPSWGMLDEVMDDMNSNLPAISNNTIKTFIPAMDVYETGKALIVESPLAGVKPENVEVSVQKGVLIVSGQGKKEREIDDKNYYRKEVHSGSFYRQIVLPTNVIEDKVKAEFEDGVLKITCPKAESIKTKKINITVTKKNKNK